jgi:two-component system, OmpR family, phosphate regulon sensor histidine kinase PhoR
MPPRVRRMRWRIAGAYILLISLTLALLSLVLLQLLRSTYLQTLQAGLAGQARLVATIAATESARASAPPDLTQLVDQLHQQLNARVTLIAADGTVLAYAPPAPSASGNLLERPEVRAALAGGQGASERASTASGEDTFYVAVPYGPTAAPTGVARIGVPLTMIAQAQSRLAAVVGVAALLAAALALALAIWIARRMTQPLLELRAMATRLAGGELTVQVPIPPDEEVAALAQDFNLMASRLRQLLATVEAERQRLATVLATMADGILMVSRDDQVTLANPAAQQLVPVPETALPVPLDALPIGAALLPTVRSVWEDRTDAAPAVIDEILTPDTRRALRAFVTRLPTPQHDQVLVVLQDLTDVRRAEQARRSLLANLSHDLRTPLASLQAMIETLQDGALDDRAVALDFLNRMDAEVQSLSRLVNEVLELSRIESGQLKLHPAPTDLGALLAAVAARMDAQAQQRAISITCALPPALPTVQVDPTRIEQVLFNLLQNALNFTPSGGAVILTADIEDDSVVVRVQDTGIGIAPDDLPHIFERFYKADRSRSGGGMGLGLAIAKHLVERHGGRIWAESQPGQGTTVCFTLALGRTADDAQR